MGQAHGLYHVSRQKLRELLITGHIWFLTHGFL
jgi:hypothetical protein